MSAPESRAAASETEVERIVDGLHALADCEDDQGYSDGVDANDLRAAASLIERLVADRDKARGEEIPAWMASSEALHDTIEALRMERSALAAINERLARERDRAIAEHRAEPAIRAALNCDLVRCEAGLAALRSENDRYEEALSRIAGASFFMSVSNMQADLLQSIARAALASPSEKPAEGEGEG